MSTKKYVPPSLRTQQAAKAVAEQKSLDVTDDLFPTLGAKVVRPHPTLNFKQKVDECLEMEQKSELERAEMLEKQRAMEGFVVLKLNGAAGAREIMQRELVREEERKQRELDEWLGYYLDGRQQTVADSELEEYKFKGDEPQPLTAMTAKAKGISGFLSVNSMRNAYLSRFAARGPKPTAKAPVTIHEDDWEESGSALSECDEE